MSYMREKNGYRKRVGFLLWPYQKRKSRPINSKGGISTC